MGQSKGPGSNHTLRKCASRQVLVPAVVLAAVTVFMLITIVTIAALAELLRAPRGLSLDLRDSLPSFTQTQNQAEGNSISDPVLLVSLSVEKSKPPVAAPGPPAVPCCPEDWIGYRGKCYYFSETDGNWTYSQSHCSALNASLAAIDSEQEKDFLLRYKGFLDRWIGLQREPGQPWRWPNGTEFDNRFPIRGGGNCVFLIDEDWFGSSRCSTWRRWICSKHNPYTMGKKRAVELKL
ncbi:C-type lectin domain family 2 member E-like [Terrapene carolina triunguis]|uniref:C-type lectin domain family 2 member E-like n=1 Tax=Terrapene triunguis TaxID=2587831 RepID=UPI0011567D6B|nr:C-type lectin domain family 2 member E-like [Terrapene carolina triunguis]